MTSTLSARCLCTWLLVLTTNAAQADVTYIDHVPSQYELRRAFGLDAPRPPTAASTMTRRGIAWFRPGASASGAAADPSASRPSDSPIAAVQTATNVPADMPVAALQTIRFELGSTTLTPESRATIDAFVKLMKDDTTVRFEIEGRADARGNRNTNTLLSWDRALAVYRLLVQRGIDADRLRPVGKGSTNPVDGSEANDVRNRCVRFALLRA